MTAEKATDIKAFLIACVAALTALWGWLGWAVVLLVLAMLTDYITGSLAARAASEWSSAVARAGLRHKLGTVIAVGTAAFADLGVKVVLNSGIMGETLSGFDWPNGFTLIVTFWYFLTELGSIIENAGKLGAPIHPWLAKGIKVLKATTTPDVFPDVSDSDTGEEYRGKHDAVPADPYAEVKKNLDFDENNMWD